MDKEQYFGVDVSKKTLDLAYYDGETIDWKNTHIQVSKMMMLGSKRLAPESQSDDSAVSVSHVAL